MNIPGIFISLYGAQSPVKNVFQYFLRLIFRTQHLDLRNTPAQLLLASISRDVSGVDVRSYGLVDQSIPPKLSVRCRSGGFANKLDFIGGRGEYPQLSLLLWWLSVPEALKADLISGEVRRRK